MEPIIRVSELSFSFVNPGGESFEALHNLSIEIEQGEWVAIVGANGSGKTTFARHLNGLLLPTQGDVRVQGMNTKDPGAINSIRTKVGMVFQFPEDQIVATSVEDDVAFGLENEEYAPEIISRKVRSALTDMDLWQLRKRQPNLLSGGQMQRLALAGILAREPEIILLDEPTAMLDPAGRSATLDQIRKFHHQGKTILFITHDMDEAALAERVVVLHAGRLAFDGSPKELFSGRHNLNKFKLEFPIAVNISRELRKSMGQKFDISITLEDLKSRLPACERSVELTRTKALKRTIPGEAWIAARGLTHTYMKGKPNAVTALHEVSFDISAGSIHGFIGATGSGKSTLLQHLNGLYRPQKGHLRVGDLDLNDTDLPLSTICRQVGMAFQNPEDQFFNTYVGDEIAYALRQLEIQGNVKDLVRSAMQQVGLDFELFKDRLVSTLSGGERRKVALASILVMQPKVLVLDEPTAGLDPLARREMLKLIKNWRKGGRTIILSSQNMEDIAELTDSVTVLAKGRVEMDDATGKVFDNLSSLQRVGLEAPAVARVSAWLRKKGWPIPAETCRLEAFSSALKRMTT